VTLDKIWKINFQAHEKKYVYIFFLRTELLIEMLGLGLQSIGMRNYRCFNLTREFFSAFVDLGSRAANTVTRSKAGSHCRAKCQVGMNSVLIFDGCGNKIWIYQMQLLVIRTKRKHILYAKVMSVI
jgi:hypothetical protein